MQTIKAPPAKRVAQGLKEVNPRIVLATDCISADDVAYSLKELNEPAPDSRGFHRYRILRFVPGGRLQAGLLTVDPKYLREWRFDMGLADLCADDQIAIIGGVPREDGQVEILETAGRLIEMAERIHAGYLAPTERPEPTNLIEAFRNQPDIRRRAKVKQSTFGTGGVIQRS